MFSATFIAVMKGGQSHNRRKALLHPTRIQIVISPIALKTHFKNIIIACTSRLSSSASNATPNGRI